MNAEHKDTQEGKLSKVPGVALRTLTVPMNTEHEDPLQGTSISMPGVQYASQLSQEGGAVPLYPGEPKDKDLIPCTVEEEEEATQVSDPLAEECWVSPRASELGPTCREKPVSAQGHLNHSGERRARGPVCPLCDAHTNLQRAKEEQERWNINTQSLLRNIGDGAQTCAGGMLQHFWDLFTEMWEQHQHFWDFFAEMRERHQHFWDLFKEMLARHQHFWDLLTEMRAQHQQHFWDLVTEMRAQYQQHFWDLLTEMRAQHQNFWVLVTEIRAQHQHFWDLFTEMRAPHQVLVIELHRQTEAMFMVQCLGGDLCKMAQVAVGFNNVYNVAPPVSPSPSLHGLQDTTSWLSPLFFPAQLSTSNQGLATSAMQHLPGPPTDLGEDLAMQSLPGPPTDLGEDLAMQRLPGPPTDLGEVLRQALLVAYNLEDA
uniref:Uncharacterized protein LOC117347160 isoform X2 n=1 Tax=Geotrypetes seraphini TaxID=260995 RepID=A0A6P8NRV1_GEOSA|nr:uncharacterized protein LOC117347160 isoform X2 [Geotrypetes seraphini]